TSPTSTGDAPNGETTRSPPCASTRPSRTRSSWIAPGWSSTPAPGPPTATARALPRGTPAAPGRDPRAPLSGRRGRAGSRDEPGTAPPEETVGAPAPHPHPPTPG